MTRLRKMMLEELERRNYSAESARFARTERGLFGEGCVQFSPMPPEPRAGRLVMAALIVNLPAVFLGAVLDILLGILHVRTGEQVLVGLSVLFVLFIWYRVGKWLDDLTACEAARRTASVHKPRQHKQREYLLVPKRLSGTDQLQMQCRFSLLNIKNICGNMCVGPKPH